MTSQPVHDRLDRKPTWTIQGVFDPDVRGQNFSYTIGLHDAGFPELHLWASPPDGIDPGEDWAFSHRDRARILNELAFKLVDGRVGPGSRWSEKFDAGLATVEFEIQSPGDRDALEALGIAPEAQVLPVAWRLERPPLGALSPLSPPDLRVAFDEYAELVRSLPRIRRPAPAGWALSPIPTFEPEQRFGPRTPVVLARAAQLWTAQDLANWVDTVVAFDSTGSLMWPTTVARGLARPAGRAGALAELEREAKVLVEHVIAERKADWRRATGVLADRLEIPRDDRAHIWDAAHHALMETTLSVLSLELVADLADRDLRVHARGPWMAAANPDLTLPGKEWAAGSRVMRTVRSLLRPLALHEWSALVTAHHREGDDAYQELCSHLALRYFMCPSGVPWSKLVDLPAGREFRHLTRHAHEWYGVVGWASCLATLLTYRADYTADQVATFVAPVRGLLPGLERVLNEVR